MKRPWAVVGILLALATLTFASYTWASSTSLEGPPPASNGGEARNAAAPSATPSNANPGEAHERQSAVDTVETNHPAHDCATDQPTSSVAAASAPTIADASIARVHSRLAERVKRQQSDSANGGKTSAAQKDGLAVDKAAIKLIEAQRYWYLGPAEQTPAYLHLNTRSTRFWSTSTKDGRVIVLEMTSYEFPEVFENDPRVL